MNAVRAWRKQHAPACRFSAPAQIDIFDMEEIPLIEAPQYFEVGATHAQNGAADSAYPRRFSRHRVAMAIEIAQRG